MDAERAARLQKESEEIAEQIINVISGRCDLNHCIDPLPTLRGLQLVTSYILSKLAPEMRETFAGPYAEELVDIAGKMQAIEFDMAKKRGPLN